MSLAPAPAPIVDTPVMPMARPAPTAPPATPEELLERPDRKAFELVDGLLMAEPVSALSSFVAAALLTELRLFCRLHGCARVFGSDCGYQFGPSTVRKPDVSVVLAARLPADQIGTGWLNVAPDLAVEVISPNDLAYALDAKIEQFRSAGVRLVWIVNPEQRTVRIHRGNGSVALLHAPDTLDGEDVLPDFQCPIAGLFEIDAPATDSAAQLST